MEPESPFAWIIPADPAGPVTEAHPDYEFWQESAEIDRWIAAGAPPVAEWLGTAPPTPQPPQAPTVPAVALALSREHAAMALSVSPDHFDAHIKPHLRLVQSGRRQLVPVRELERWVEANAARALKD